MAADSKASKKNKGSSKGLISHDGVSKPSKRKSVQLEAEDGSAPKAKKSKKADVPSVTAKTASITIAEVVPPESERSKKKQRAVASDFLDLPPDPPLSEPSDVPRAAPAISSTSSKKSRKLPAAVAERWGAADDAALEIPVELPADAKVLSDGEARRVSSEVIKKKKKKDKALKEAAKEMEVDGEEEEAPAQKKKAKAKASEPEEEGAAEADAEWTGFGSQEDAKANGFDEDMEDEEEDVDEDDVHLHGFSSTDQDSSDEDLSQDEEGIDVGTLPTIARDDAAVKKRLEKAKKAAKAAKEDRGVIYLGRLPHGFYEQQLRAYFSQFGEVTRLRVSRNKTTGRSKHYAFLEFDSSSVAEIVAETMHNYLLAGRLLQCKVITKEEIHPNLWVGANRKYRVVPRGRIAKVKHDKERTDEQKEKVEQRLVKRQEKTKEKLKAAGIDYDFDGVSWKK